ncbi:DUF268 domain-containing protein [Candidatus Latescibacterota bacterium]
MRKFDSRLKNFAYLLYRWAKPFCDPLEFMAAGPRYVGFFRDWITYLKSEGAERTPLGDTYPIIHEKTEATRFDAHYFYQDIWAFKKIMKSDADAHVDVGSRVDFVGFLAAVIPVTFIDIRPLEVTLENLVSTKGSILSLPFEDGSLRSLSCLHVAEHVGLGRYGDTIDPLGTRKACSELSRVLTLDGNLYFTVPVGKPRVCFNSHRIHSPFQILEYFHDLTLVEFSGIGDNRRYVKNCDMSLFEQYDFACGLFHFKNMREFKLNKDAV